MNGRTKSKACLIISIFLLGLACPAAAGRTIYVDADASGANDGSSWADAYNYLQDALTDANSALKPIEIRVAEGIYTPDSNSANPNGSGDRTATFQLINGVTLKGGYAGFGASDPNARDIEPYETILSGDLAGNDGLNFENNNENSYHVVVGSWTDSTAVLDGFTITAGNANKPLPPMPIPLAMGVELYNYSLSLTPTTYTSDGKSMNGGGMYNNFGSPTLSNCTLRVNWARYGGGMENRNGSNPRLTNCIFSGNSAGSSGGGLYNSTSSPTLTACTFTNNSAVGSESWVMSDGGGMCNSGNSSPMLTNCTFSGNSAESGGGIYSWYSNPKLTNCTFSRNVATGIYGVGGGMTNLRYSSPEINNCSFIANYAWLGSGIHNDDSNPTITNCMFNGNSATSRGGGMCNLGGSPTLTKCTFSRNTAGQDSGGGMWNGGSSIILNNCLFNQNSAAVSGGGLDNSGSSLTLTNCTFSSNTAPDGDALGCDSYMKKYPSDIQFDNCVLWDGGNEIWNNDSSVITITYSDVRGGWIGEGNIDDDPCFAKRGYQDANSVWIDGDYHLMSDSPCIDAGDPNYVPEPNEIDLDGKPRVINGRIDMGAYEYSPPIQAYVRIVPRTINLASEGRWITSYIWLFEGYDVAEIDPKSIKLNDEIQPEQVWVDEEQQIAMARFDRSDVQDILDVGQVDLTITGWLTDGTAFEGSDVIRVLYKGGGKSAKKKK